MSEEKKSRPALPFRLAVPPVANPHHRRKPRRPAKGLSLNCMQRPVSRVYSGNLRNVAVELQDVGWGGVRFVASEPLQAASPLNLQIREEASGEVLHARGEVAWVRTQREGEREFHVVGVKFAEILTDPAKCGRFFGDIPAPKATAPESPKPAPQRRGGNRFSLSDCEVVLERDHRFRAQEKPGNLASQLLDLSRSGAQVVSTEPLRRGERVRLTVILKKYQDIFTAEAEAVWTRDLRPAADRSWRVGLAFGSLDHAQERKLQSLERWFAGATSIRPKPAP